MNIAVIFSTLLYLNAASAYTGACYSSVVSRWAYYSYYTYTYYDTYYYSCGWWKWKRCSGTTTLYSTAGQYNPTTYSTKSYCCSGYTGSAPSGCTPVCSPSCVHGTCSSPSTCTCDSGWTGSICRDDSSLFNWCSSITGNDIKNNYLSGVTANHIVYCESTSSTYQSSQATYVSQRMLADSNRCSSTYRYSLYQFWKQHPYVRKFCCYSNSNYHVTLLNKLIRFDSNFYGYVGGLKSGVAIELRKELKKLCPSSLSDAFCPIKAALDIIDLAASLPSSKSQWTSETKKYKEAILVSVAILKQEHSEQYTNLKITESDILVECTNIILKYMQNKETSKMKTFASYLPPSDAYKPSATSCNNDQLCIFMKIVEQVHMYIDEADLDTNPVLVNGNKRLILNTGTDYREFLRQKQLDRILTILAEQHSTSLQIANHLKKHTTTKFTELRSYFEKVATFNEKIAEADIAYITDRVEKYSTELDKVQKTMETDVGTLIFQTTVAAGVDVAERAVLLAVAIASQFNPLKAIFGGPDVSRVLDATADLKRAISGVVKIASVSRAFDELKNTIEDLTEKLEENDDFLKTVNDLIYKKTNTIEEFEKLKDDFIEKYKEYDPKVTLPEITEVGAYWESLVDAACSLLDGIDTITGSIPKDIVNDKGLCESIPTLVAQYTSILEEIYEHQFDLMDAMASYVRSAVALNATKEIRDEFTEVTQLDVHKDTALTTLAMIGGLSYMVYKTHVLHTVHLYCNVLEYMEGSKKPVECKGVDTDIALLIANIEPVCVSETYQFYSIPTKPSSDNDTAFANVTQLFSGSEISFKISDSQWLVDNDWINAVEKDYAFYVKRFEVFLPTKSKYPRKFYSTADPVLHNAVVPGSTEYIIVPHTHLVFEYSLGPSSLRCHRPKIRNPYTACETTGISEICLLSEQPERPLYPSIYSQWRLSIEGAGDMTPPNPTTDMSIIFGIQLCKVAPESYVRKDRVRLQDIGENENCCPSGEFRPNVTTDCATCPFGSHSALAGYYCEKD